MLSYRGTHCRIIASLLGGQLLWYKRISILSKPYWGSHKVVACNLFWNCCPSKERVALRKLFPRRNFWYAVQTNHKLVVCIDRDNMIPSAIMRRLRRCQFRRFSVIKFASREQNESDASLKHYYVDIIRYDIVKTKSMIYKVPRDFVASLDICVTTLTFSLLRRIDVLNNTFKIMTIMFLFDSTDMALLIR